MDFCVGLGGCTCTYTYGVDVRACFADLYVQARILPYRFKLHRGGCLVRRFQFPKTSACDGVKAYRLSYSLSYRANYKLHITAKMYRGDPVSNAYMAETYSMSRTCNICMNANVNVHST